MTNRQTIKRFLEPLSYAKLNMFNMLLLDIATMAQVVFLVYFVQYAVQELEGGNSSGFFFWIQMMLLLSVVGLIIKIFWKPRVFNVFRDLRVQIDKLYLKKIIYGNNNKFESVGTGKLIAIYNKGADTWVELGTNFLSDGLTTLFLFGAFLYTTGTKDSTLFRGVLCTMFLIIIWFYFVGGLSYPWREKAKIITLEKSRIRVRRFMSKYEIIQSDKVDSELKKSSKIYHNRFLAKKIEKYYQGYAFDVPFFFACLLFTGLVRYSGNQLTQGNLSFADITGIIGIGTIFIKDLDNLLRRFRFLFDKRIDIIKLRELADDLQAGNRDITIGKIFLSKTQKIDCKNLSYGYTTHENIFKDFSLTIQGGIKTALVGPSGGGKTTLVKLIAGYLEPDSGKIIIDGQNLAETNLISYYKHVGYLTQEPSVFDGSIRENLQYGMDQSVAENKVNKSIENVLPLAKCERIYDLPQGIDTEIGERGVRLSGGQKQRLAIAKIMLKNPDIILLDEPTSALDSANEQAVTEALNNLFKNKTVIIIAHRLQTVKNADDIIYIANGKVVERGTHDQLLALGGEYYKMVELQSGF